jgi:hypothetical protein
VDAPDRLHQNLDGGVLEDEALGAVANGGPMVVGAADARQHEELRGRERARDLAKGPVGLPRIGIEDDDVRLGRRDPHFVTRSALADDLEVRLRRQKSPEAGAHHPVLSQQEESDDGRPVLHANLRSPWTREPPRCRPPNGTGEFAVET